MMSQVAACMKNENASDFILVRCKPLFYEGDKPLIDKSFSVWV